MMATGTGAQCVSCGTSLAGPYCSQCGEAAPERNYSLVHFAEEALETIAHVDGRVFATFRALLTRPGLLPSEFLRGRRKTQMGPFQLFVVCNVLYFLLQPLTVFATFTSTLQIQTTERSWAGFARRLTEKKAASRHITIEQYAHDFDHTAHLQGKSLVVIMVPICALGVWAAYGRTRRFYAEHLVFSFYFYAVILLWMALAALALSRPILFAIQHKWHDDWIDPVSDVVIAAPVVVYLLLAVRRMYGGGWLSSGIKAAGLFAWMIFVLTAYRFILFLTTFYAT